MSTLATLSRRAILLQAVRNFFISRSYLEVETPVRIPAPAPEAHIEPEISDGWYLQTSPELCMKRLLASGCPALFQICKCFRRGERGERHLPEFTMLEWYRAGYDYHHIMAECEEFVFLLNKQLYQRTFCLLGFHTVSLQPPWDRMTVAEAFARYSPVPLEQALAADTFEEMLCLHIEPRLGLARPVFLYDFPAPLASLARLRGKEHTVAERFELYIGGLEIANGFSELTDTEEQRQRFLREQQLVRNQGRTPPPLPDRFLDDLTRVEEAAGIAFGIDRLAMALWNAATIDEVVFFTPENL
jgi:lysyl-tRNA synthetase class 2